MVWRFLFVLASGFYSPLYEIVGLRLCVAHLGVRSAMVSIVLSALDSEFFLDRMIAEEPDAPALRDDGSLNESFAIRRLWPNSGRQ